MLMIRTVKSRKYKHPGSINAGSKGYVVQMEALNRNVSGLNAIYEIQLKSIGSQLESIEKVNEGMKQMTVSINISTSVPMPMASNTLPPGRYRNLNIAPEHRIAA